MATRFLFALLGALTFSIAVSASEPWKVRQLGDSLQVSYPADWKIISDSPTQLAILLGRRAEGVVIGPHAALIQVSVDAAAKQLDQALASEIRDVPVLSRRTVVVPGLTRDPGCGTFEEVVGKEEYGPNVYQISTLLFCRTGSYDIVLLVSNWQGDKNQGLYQDTARRMLQSVSGIPGNQTVAK